MSVCSVYYRLCASPIDANGEQCGEIGNYHYHGVCKQMSHDCWVM